MARTKAEVKNEEVKEVEVKEVAKVEDKVEEKSLVKKLNDLKEFLAKADITGIQLLEINEQNKVLRSNLLVEGQALPMFIVLNDTVYTYIQVHLVTLTEDKKAKCVDFLNELNERFSMLKYFVNSQGNVVLTCSIPAGDDKFDPALIFALVDQVKLHLEENYPALMKKIWQD